MKKYIMTILMLIMSCSLWSCSYGKDVDVHVENSNNNFSLSELENLEFTFLSGSGSWCTTMNIASDGTFQGIFQDSDMGSQNEYYPNGTKYYCAFQGKFSEPVQKDEFIYSMRIDEISYENPVGTEEIKDGIRYIYSDAYGLDDPEEILIYIPGMPIDELPEGYLSWVRSNWKMDFEFTKTHTTLPFYGLYNVNAEQGFSSYVLENSIITVGNPIKEQCFDVTLEEWGTVTFASYEPEDPYFYVNDWYPDVRFYLMDGEKALYEFPGWDDKHLTSDVFVTVSAVAFEDYNNDGFLDIITICEYETMSGESYQSARIYFQIESEKKFEEEALLTEYLSKNHKTGSVAEIIESKDEYWDYKASLDGHRSVYNQLTIIAENKDMWTADLEYANEVYRYTISDLDCNGRYEIIVSNMGGTGIYTYSRFFEINQTYDGLVECSTDFVEYDSQPDIITEKIDTYVDDNGEFHYALYDVTRNGMAEYYENVRELVLRDSKIITKYIVNKTTIYEDEKPTITCQDYEGNIITEEEYEIVVDYYFSNWKKYTTHLGWRDVRELADDVEEIRKQLEDSYNVYYRE